MLKSILLLAVLSFSICSAQTNTKLKAVWTQIDTLNIARYNHASIVLPNGNILVSGGVGNGAAKSCEIYDLQTQKWRLTASMNSGRENHKMFLLKNNKVIAVGGVENRSCEIFDPEIETWTDTDSLSTIKFLWEATLQLRDGNILVSGGLRLLYNGSPALMLNDCELYNAETGKWKTIAQLNNARMWHSITELNNGKILAVGGEDNNGNQLKSCEIYDPVQNTWTTVAPLNISRDLHASYLLPDGNVLVAGGYTSTSNSGYPQYSCEIYNSVTNSWMVADNLYKAKVDPRIYTLSNTGKLLILGGSGLYMSWEVYDPVNLKSLYWGDSSDSKQSICMYQNSVQMKNESIMLIGGEDVTNIETMPSLSPTNKCYIMRIETDMAVERTDELPKDFCLYQNYPNPFNPTTKIKFSITKASRVSLTVFDMLGRIVTKLIDNEEKSAGVYTADFSAQGLASGVYLYQLTAGNRIYTNKMLLTK
jgi:N-acetylneuraminic acid mutarotase